MLRPYQQRAVEEVKEAWGKGHKRVLLVMSTGAGKTITGTEFVRRTVENGGRVAWITHRVELIDQAYDTLQRAGISVGALCASSTRAANPFRPVQVASIQTLIARGEAPPARLLVVDEAHHIASELWSKIPKSYGDVFILGLTATPERADGTGLGAVFSEMVRGPSMRDLIAAGALVPCRIVRPRKPLMTRQIAQHPVDAWRDAGESRKSVVFSPDVRWAEIHRDQFRAAGVSAELVTAESPNRAEILAGFRDGRVQVLVNVYVLTEGFDCPDASCVILARGCGTTGTYLQMVGRALRPAPGKSDALLIDLSGASHKHGAPDEDRIFSLKGKGIQRKGKAIETYCPRCGCVADDEPPCPHCGYAPDPSELSVTKDPLVKFAAKRRETDEERTQTAVNWIRKCDELGHNRRAIFHKWRAVYGEALSPERFRAAVRVVDSGRDSGCGVPDESGDTLGESPGEGSSAA